MLLLCTWGEADVKLAIDYTGLTSASQLVQICSSTLVQLNRSKTTLEFSHPSVESFLLPGESKCHEKVHGLTFDYWQLQAHMAFRCLNRLILGTEGPFLDYSAMNMLLHARRAWEIPGASIPQDFIESFGRADATGFLAWRRHQHRAWNLGDDPVEERYPTPLHVSLYWSYFKTARAILDLDHTGYDCKSIFGTPLQLAVSENHLQLATALVELGADVDAPPGTDGSAIYRACFKNVHIEILQLLLAKDPKTTLNMPCKGEKDLDYETPLYAAIVQGNERFVELLLKAGASPNSRGRSYGNALQTASALGHVSIVELLLQYDCDPKVMSGPYGTAFLAAFHGTGDNKGHERIAEILSPNSIAPTAHGSLWREAIVAAEEMVTADGTIHRGWLDVCWLELSRYRPYLDKWRGAGDMPRTTMQWRTIWAYQYTVLTDHLSDSIQSNLPREDASGLWRQIKIGFDRNDASWGLNTKHAFDKQYFRALLHSFISEVRSSSQICQRGLTSHSGASSSCSAATAA